MTVAIVLVTPDGVVAAADSRTSVQISEEAPMRVLSDFTNKVFQVGENAIVTYGWAFLLRRNVAGHMVEFEREFSQFGVRDLSTHLAQFFGDRFDEHISEGLDEAVEDDQIGFIVAGYEDGIGRAFEVLLPSRTVEEISNSSDRPGVAWRGQSGVIARLIKGVDWEIVPHFAEQDGKASELEDLLPTLQKAEYGIPIESWNLQDGIDFAVLAIRTTIDVQRLTHGYTGAPGSWPGVGGPIQIGVVRAATGFQWLQRTELQGERPAGEAEQI